MNLENLNVVQLSTTEVSQVEGCWFNWFSNCFGPSWNFGNYNSGPIYA